MAWTAERLKAFRKGLGLTQAGFADEIGVSLPTIKYWETGGPIPRMASNYLTLLEKNLRAAKRKLQTA